MRNKFGMCLKANWSSAGVVLVFCLVPAFLVWQFIISSCSFSEIISDWQTLITGWIALLGALLTISQIKKTQKEDHQRLQKAQKEDHRRLQEAQKKDHSQLQEAQKEDHRRSQEAQKEDQENKLKRALIFLPNALDDICTYANENMVAIRESVDGPNPKEGFPLKLADSVLEKLASIAEYSEGAEREAIMKLSRHYQICYSRGRSHYRSEPTPVTAHRLRFGLLCDFSDLHSYANRLFDFARERENDIQSGKITLGEHEGSLHSAFSSVFSGWGGENLFSKPGFSDYQKKRYTTS